MSENVKDLNVLILKFQVFVGHALFDLHLFFVNIMKRIKRKLKANTYDGIKLFYLILDFDLNSLHLRVVDNSASWKKK